VKNIYVGNLDFTATEDQVRTAFEQHGAVDKVTLVRDRATGQSRGFAFVEMPNDTEGEKAIAALNGSSMGGRNLNVNEARPKMERSGGGGFGGNRGGSGGRGGRGRGRY
jgi:RNA recognition motif-containing protein